VGEQGGVTDREAIALLTRWVRELQTDLSRARKQIGVLEFDVRNLKSRLNEQETRMGYMREWMTNHTPTQIVELAAELSEVA
jgi:hypothetical protein